MSELTMAEALYGWAIVNVCIGLVVGMAIFAWVGANERRTYPEPAPQLDPDVAEVENAILAKWAKAEDDRKARSLANKAALAEVTDEDRVEIAALIRNTGCRVGEWAA